MTTEHVVALSGGKDSTALALRLRELHPETPYRYICTPTGDELPEMFAHWRHLSELLGAPLVPIGDTTLAGEIARQGALPNYRMRWCTRIIKIEPTARYLAALAATGVEVVLYVGLRADEDVREGGNYAAVSGVTQRFPLREWGWRVGDVLDYLDRRGVSIPKRTDCARCFYQKLSEWWGLWAEHPDLYADAERDEAATGHTFRSPGRDSWPAGLVQLRREFERGRVPKGAGQGDLLRAATCRVCSL